MTNTQKIAIENPCYMGFETMNPLYHEKIQTPGQVVSRIITVATGYE